MQRKLGMTGHINDEASAERYTPAWIIAIAHETMGGIDLDPCSCAEANKTVRATRYYTEQDDGLDFPWEGRVWMNPPYVRNVVRWFSEKLLKEDPAESMTLLLSSFDASWYRELLKYQQAVAIMQEIVTFNTPGQTASNKYVNDDGVSRYRLRPIALGYHGPNVDTFLDICSYDERFGTLWEARH